MLCYDTNFIYDSFDSRIERSKSRWSNISMDRFITNLSRFVTEACRWTGSARDATLSSSSNLYFLHPPLPVQRCYRFACISTGKLNPFVRTWPYLSPWIIFTVIFHLSDIDSLGLDNNPLTIPFPILHFPVSDSTL